MVLQPTTLTSTLLNLKQIHIEVSSKCTLKCPRCPRTELKPEDLNREISLADFKKAFPPDVLQEINDITFCGDIGDPIYATEFIPIVRYIKQHHFGCSLTIVTNGSYKDADWWEELGALLHNNDQVTFSVDGWDQESNERYRVNSNFDSIIAGARALRKASNCRMNWSAIYFSFNEKEMDWIEDLARELGFDTFERVYSSKFDNQYTINGFDPLKPVGGYVSKARYEAYRKTIGSRGEPIKIHYNHTKHPWARCINWQKEMFISVSGLVFPCPWFNSGYLENDFVDKYKDSINIRTRPLMDILNDPLWEELLTRFEIAPLEICKFKCRDAQQ